MSKQRRFISLVAITAMAFFGRLPAADAGCGCQKAPPELAAVRPNATYPGTPITLFSPSFQVGQAYAVDFASGTTTAKATVTGTVSNRRDLADGVYKPQLVVTLPSLPLGPTRITARLSNLTTPVLTLTDDAFTVVPVPVAVPQDLGSSSYKDFSAAIGRDGTFYISLDMTAVTLPRVLRAQAKGYPLRFVSDDITFFNIQGIQMQLLGANMPGLYSISASGSTTDSDILGYSRHEFSTYYVRHQERQPHALDPTDPNWHVDGTRHVDHNHLVLAIAGVVNGVPPMPGSTAVFQLVLHRFSLFQNGLVGVSTATDAMKIDFRSGTDSYDSRNGTYGHVGDVVTNGSMQVGGWAVVDGNARATSFSVYRGAKITGQTTVQTQPEVVMPVQVPDLLTNLGDINLSGSQIQTIGRGSYQVGSIVMGSRAILNIDNCAGPVTLYVTNSSRAVALSDQAEISTCDPNPEKFAIYVANPGSVTMSGDGQFHGVVYAPESPFDISTTSAFYGAFIGNTMHTSGYAKVHYDPSLRGQ